MKYKILLLIPTILFLLAACNNRDQKDKTATEQNVLQIDSNVIKVYVDQAGQITADGNSVSLNNLDSAFSKLKTSNGTVYYSRDNAQADPPAESMKIMDLIVKYSLPVKFYTDKTFNEIMKPN